MQDARTKNQDERTKNQESRIEELKNQELKKQEALDWKITSTISDSSWLLALVSCFLFLGS
jgi:hypothetical protein